MAWMTEKQVIKWLSAGLLLLTTLAAHGNELPAGLQPWREWIELGGLLGTALQMFFIQPRRQEWTDEERAAALGKEDDDA